MFGEGPTFGITGSFGSPEKKFSISFSKANTGFCSGLHYNPDNSWERNLLSLKLTTKMLTFEHNFVSEVYLIDLVLLV